MQLWHCVEAQVPQLCRDVPAANEEFDAAISTADISPKEKIFIGQFSSLIEAFKSLRGVRVGGM